MLTKVFSFLVDLPKYYYSSLLTSLGYTSKINSQDEAMFTKCAFVSLLVCCCWIDICTLRNRDLSDTIPYIFVGVRPCRMNRTAMPSQLNCITFLSALLDNHVWVVVKSDFASKARLGF